MMFVANNNNITSRKNSFTSALLFKYVWIFFVISIVSPVVRGDFNYEVEKRVLERIHDFMNGPVTTTSLTSKYRYGGGFSYNMDARDRDKYLVYAYTYMQQFTFDMVYYGMEDGMFLGYGRHWGTYREPANNYNVSHMQTNDMKYYYSCLNRETGEPEKCIMATESKYVKCIDDCQVQVCPDLKSQTCYQYQQNAANNNTTIAHSCQPDDIKWCTQYDVLETSSSTVQQEQEKQEQEQHSVGFVPRFYYCHDRLGRFTQQVGNVLQSDGKTLGNCTYGDGTTLVNHTTSAYYEYCNGEKCNALKGAYRSRDYDPRYRSWYTITKEIQEPNWSPPYPFFTKLELGITYSHPIYSYDSSGNKKVFAGVLAVDYTFSEISNFLRNSYWNTSTLIAVYEKNKPNYVVASSTGRKPARHVLTEDPTKPCPDVEGSANLCTVVRYEMATLEGHPMDHLLIRAYESQKEKGYPRELVSFKDGDKTDSKIYVSQSSEYHVGNLEWIILVISAAKDTGEVYALTIDDPLFGAVSFISVLGIFLCLALFVLFYRKRKKRAVFLRDWRFTCAFILGCAIMNISSLTMLGPNTDALCITRMWSFHLLFVVAVSPLFVKIWRIHVLADCSARARRISVTNRKAAIYTMPFIAAQAFILVCFSIFDPPKQKEVITIAEGVVTQQIVCAQKLPVIFIIIELCFEAGLVLIGCVLAYKTRELNKDFGESRELMFSMYNIAFIGITTSVAIFLMGIDRAGQITSIAMGVFWGTVFSSATFVLPRLMQAKKEDMQLRVGNLGSSRYSNIRISGLDSTAFNRLSSQQPSFRLQRLDNEICLIPESEAEGGDNTRDTCPDDTDAEGGNFDEEDDDGS